MGQQRVGLLLELMDRGSEPAGQAADQRAEVIGAGVAQEYFAACDGGGVMSGNDVARRNNSLQAV